VAASYTFAGQSSLAGPPAEGTYAVNNVIADVNGTLWVCTVAGTPGTWEEAGSTSPLGPSFMSLVHGIQDEGSPT
jgi:hypothetical protein